MQETAGQHGPLAHRGVAQLSSRASAVSLASQGGEAVITVGRSRALRSLRSFAARSRWVPLVDEICRVCWRGLRAPAGCARRSPEPFFLLVTLLLGRPRCSSRSRRAECRSEPEVAAEPRAAAGGRSQRRRRGMEPARVLLGSACPRGLLIQQLAVAAPSMHLAVGARSDTAGRYDGRPAFSQGRWHLDCAWAARSAPAQYAHHARLSVPIL